MAARPQETQSTADKDLNSDRLSIRSAGIGIAGGETTKSFARHNLNTDSPSSPASHKSPATPSKASSSVAPRKLKPASPIGSAISQDEDSRSIFSVQSERSRGPSIADSSVRDDKSLASSTSVPSYMATSHSAKAKSRMSSPLGMENGITPEKGSAGSAKKRPSFPPTARPRRHSGTPKVDTNSVAENGVNGVVNQLNISYWNPVGDGPYGYILAENSQEISKRVI